MSASLGPCYSLASSAGGDRTLTRRTPWRDSGHPDDLTEPLPRLGHGWPGAPAGSIFPSESRSFPGTPEGDQRRRERHLRRLILVIGYLTGLTQGLLLIRVAFMILGANPAAPAAAWVYAGTAPLVFLFENLFPTLRAGGSAIELHVLFAIAFYTSLGFGLKRLGGLWLGELRRRTRQ